MATRIVDRQDVHALDVVRELLPWRERLATAFGTGHGNADLQLIDVLIVMLAGFFNPLVRSQRLVEALSSQDWIGALLICAALVLIRVPERKNGGEAAVRY